MMGLDRDRLTELVQVVVRNPLRAFLSTLVEEAEGPAS